jgi:hypothetical protein
MLGLKERLRQASGYSAADFHNADSIGVICRGPSVYRLDLCYKKFDHCYLSGEFNNTLYRIKNHLEDKKIVMCIMQQSRYRTLKQNCDKFNIKNLQVRYQNGTKYHKKCILEFPNLRVVGFTKEHYNIVADINKNNGESNHSIFSTGMSAIISALYFNPKDIHIIGVDFYDRSVKPYFVREDRDIPSTKRIIDSINGLRPGMLKSISNICDLFPHINLHLYTTYRGIRSRKNLYVRYV